MEDIIKSIVSIDNKASDIIRHTEEYLRDREKDIKEKIEAMRTEIMDKTKNEAAILYDSIIKEAEAQAEEIRNRTKAECSNLESKFLKIREKLGSQLFSRLFN